MREDGWADSGQLSAGETLVTPFRKLPQQPSQI